MFVRELTTEYYTINLDLPRLTAIESRWSFICQKLNGLTHDKWANLQLKGRWSKFEIDISALPSNVGKKLEDATASLRWPNEHFADTIDFASYRLTVQHSTPDEEYTTVNMSRPGSPLPTVGVFCSRTVRPQISASERFRLRRERRGREEMSRESKTDTSQS
jgi:hypothetical protein